jgi:hypothetical protein
MSLTEASKNSLDQTFGRPNKMKKRSQWPRLRFDSGLLYSAQRRKTSDPLVPPKPNEFDSA